MTKFCLIPILLTLCVAPVSAKVVPGGGIVAATAAIGVTARNGELSSQFQSDCAGCHREIFPFKAPETCLVKRGPDCWEEQEINEKTKMMYRGQRKIRKIYRFDERYRPTRYFLPADDLKPNPHYLLEEDSPVDGDGAK